MTFGGSGEQPTHIPGRQHSEAPLQTPENLESRRVQIWNRFKVWCGIALLIVLAAFFLISIISSGEYR